jgi:hypothetical protein
VRVQFDVDGKPVEELVRGVVECEFWRIGRFASRNCTASNILMIRPPQGQLDALLAMPEFVATMNKRKPNLEWVSRRKVDNQMALQRDINGSIQSRANNRAMLAAVARNFEDTMRNGRIASDTLTENKRIFNDNLQRSTNRSIAEDQERQNRMNIEANQWRLFAGDQQENTNPYNGQTVVTSNRYRQQWISSNGQTVVGTNNGENPNDYVGPGGETFGLMTPH